MQKLFSITIVLLFVQQMAFSQSVNYPNLGISFNPRFGNGKVHSKDMPNQHGLFNGGDLLLSLNISEKLTLSTGPGILTFNANSVSGSSTEIDFFHLPLKINYVTSHKPVAFGVGIGGFYNSHLTTKTDFQGQTTELKNQGSNVGVLAELGMVFRLSDRLQSNIMLEHQFSLSKLKQNNHDVENYLVKFGIQYNFLKK